MVLYDIELFLSLKRISLRFDDFLASFSISAIECRKIVKAAISISVNITCTNGTFLRDTILSFMIVTVTALTVEV